MCAMIQKLRMNFGSISSGYRFRSATAFIFSMTGRSRMLRGAKAPGAKPCRVTVQFATRSEWWVVSSGQETGGGGRISEIAPKTLAALARLRKRRCSRNDETTGDSRVVVGGNSCVCAGPKAGADVEKRFAAAIEGHAYQQQLVRVRGCGGRGRDSGAGELEGWQRESFRRPVGVSHLVLERAQPSQHERRASGEV